MSRFQIRAVCTRVRAVRFEKKQVRSHSRGTTVEGRVTTVDSREPNSDRHRTSVDSQLPKADLLSPAVDLSSSLNEPEDAGPDSKDLTSNPQDSKIRVSEPTFLGEIPTAERQPPAVDIRKMNSEVGPGRTDSYHGASHPLGPSELFRAGFEHLSPADSGKSGPAGVAELR